jgi:hypothetical protein
MCGMACTLYYNARRHKGDTKFIEMSRTNHIGSSGGVEPKEGDPVEWGTVVIASAGPLRSSVSPQIADALLRLETRMSQDIDELRMPSLEIVKNRQRRKDFAIL